MRAGQQTGSHLSVFCRVNCFVFSGLACCQSVVKILEMLLKYYSLITGASSGIGEACARRLAARNQNLILTARRLDRLVALAEELTQKYQVDVKVVAADFMNLADIDSLMDGLSELKINILINNAGFALGKSPLHEYDWLDFEQMIGVNVKAFTRVAQLCIPKIIETKGHIVNISSIAGIEAYEGGSVYCGTKAFVKMVSKAMRIDLAGTGVRVTDVAPGAVETEFSLVRFKGDKSKADVVYEGFVPLVADDVADVIDFAITRPAHVNIEYLVITPTAQASATRISRG